MNSLRAASIAAIASLGILSNAHGTALYSTASTGAVGSTGMAGDTGGDAVIFGPDSATAFQDMNGTGLNDTNSVPRIGSNSASTAPNYARVPVFVFQLPTLGAVTNPFQSASASINIYKNSNPAFNVDLYGLGSRATPYVATSDFYEGYQGSVDTTDATLLQAGFADPTAATANVAVTTSDTGSAALVTYLNAAYAGGTGAGKYVFLRPTPNGDVGTGDNFYGTTTAYNYAPANGSLPVINYTLVPEPASMSLIAGSIAAALLHRRRRAE